MERQLGLQKVDDWLFIKSLVNLNCTLCHEVYNQFNFK